jgi:ubiquitin C-terminal hydrolase
MNTNIAKQNPNLIQLCPIYYDLIQNLWKKDATFKSFSPNEFMNSIAEMTQNDQVQFSLYEAGDAKDFIIYLLERMHNELKQPLKNKFWKIEPKDQQLNQYDKNNSFLHFLDEFQNDTSIISDLFYGFNETTNVCQYCKKDFNSKGQNEPICYNYGIFNILIFPLEEVRKYREQFMAFNNVNFSMGNMSNMVTMFECFLFNQKSDFFTGDNKNYCNICKQLYDSVYTSKIFSSPNVLIIILNRGKGNMYNIKLDFALQMDISDYVLTKQGKEIYNLYGVITQVGESGPNAHFVASCKSPVDSKWYRYNDDLVEPIQDFKKDVYDFGTPYILFYEKQK